jgi:hypothetical protein
MAEVCNNEREEKRVEKGMLPQNTLAHWQRGMGCRVVVRDGKESRAVAIGAYLSATTLNLKLPQNGPRLRSARDPHSLASSPVSCNLVLLPSFSAQGDS